MPRIIWWCCFSDLSYFRRYFVFSWAKIELKKFCNFLQKLRVYCTAVYKQCKFISKKIWRKISQEFCTYVLFRGNNTNLVMFLKQILKITTVRFIFTSRNFNWNLHLVLYFYLVCSYNETCGILNKFLITKIYWTIVICFIYYMYKIL